MIPELSALVNSTYKRSKGFTKKKRISKTGSTNSRSNSQTSEVTAQIHWLQGITHKVSMEELALAINIVPVESWVDHGQGEYFFGKKWAHKLTSSTGVSIYGRNLDQPGECLFIIPGQACEMMNNRQIHALIKTLLKEYKTKFTRLDVKARVPKSMIDRDRLLEEADKGNLTGVKKLPTTVLSRAAKIVNGKRMVVEFPTDYYGSRESDSFTRIYDPQINHGVQGAVDIEVELKRAKAAEFITYFCCDIEENFEELFHQRIVDVVFGQIDFRDKSKGGKNLGRCPRLPFWQKIIDAVKAVPFRIRVPRIEPTFARFEKFAERQLMNGLAALASAKGLTAVINWIRDRIVERIDNLPPQWQRRLLRYESELSFYDKYFDDFEFPPVSIDLTASMQ